MKFILKKLALILLGVIWFLGSCAIGLAARGELTSFNVSVSGYYRGDGTYVRGHSRRPPGGAKHDEPYEIIIFVSLISLAGSVVFVGKNIKELRYEWRYQLNWYRKERIDVHVAKEIKPIKPVKPARTHQSFDSRKSPLEYRIQNAIFLQKLISFNYIDKSGKKTYRTIKPDGFRTIYRAKCVYGYCHLRKAKRTFVLNRMKNVKIT